MTFGLLVVDHSFFFPMVYFSGDNSDTDMKIMKDTDAANALTRSDVHMFS